MEAFFYYGDLVAQAYLLEIENPTDSSKPESAKISWLARISGWFSNAHHWLTVPIQAEAEEAYYQGLMPTYWNGY